MPLAERGAYDINIAVAYTLDQAIQRMDWGAIDVRDPVTIIDNLTNDVRGRKLRSSLTPEDFIRGVNQLRASVMRAGGKHT